MMHQDLSLGVDRQSAIRLLRVVATILCTVFAIGCQTNEPVSSNDKPKDPNHVNTSQRDNREEKIATERRELYERHCVGCHGVDGDGQGYASWLLFPKPRDFGGDQFRLISSEKRNPTLEDVEKAISRGMPGSGMLPWSHLSKRERKLLAEEVLRLREAGLRRLFFATAEKEEGGEVDEEEPEEKGVAAFLQERLESGQAVKIPKIGEPDEETLARGKFLYFKQSCHMCHGNEGRGDGRKQMIDDHGLPTKPRDFTRGIFKGDHDPASVYLRIALGMPGTPMPSSRDTLSPERMMDITHFVLSMSNEDLRQRAILRREKLIVKHVEVSPESFDAALWADVKPIQLRMTPLWWRNGADPDLEIQAVHDGKNVALRLAWRDTTHNDGSDPESKATMDGAALELYRGDEEPFIGLGSPSPVEVWYWRADNKASGDTGDSSTEVEGFTADQPGGIPPLPWERDTNETVRTFVGSGTVTFQIPRVRKAKAQAQWKDDRWTMVLSGPMQFEDENFIKLEPGDMVSIAFAIWNGALHDEGGKKAITVWQDFVLEDGD